MKHTELEDKLAKSTHTVITLMTKSGRVSKDLLKLADKLIDDAQDKKENKTKIPLKKMLKKDDWEELPPENTEKEIKNFKKFAKKHNVQYAIKVEKNSDPPKYAIILRGDPKNVVKAIQEWNKDNLKREKMPPIKERLGDAIKEVAKIFERDKDKVREKDKSKGRDDGR